MPHKTSFVWYNFVELWKDTFRQRLSVNRQISSCLNIVTLLPNIYFCIFSWYIKTSQFQYIYNKRLRCLLKCAQTNKNVVALHPSLGAPLWAAGPEGDTPPVRVCCTEPGGAAPVGQAEPLARPLGFDRGAARLVRSPAQGVREVLQGEAGSKVGAQAGRGGQGRTPKIPLLPILHTAASHNCFKSGWCFIFKRMFYERESWSAILFKWVP